MATEFTLAGCADDLRRCEPGTEEISYPRIAQALRDIGYQGRSVWKRGPLATANVRWNPFRTVFTKDSIS